MKLPVITVIIPAYNHAHFIEETIRSVIAQTYSNIELIILNDGSKDNTTEVVESLAEECKQRFLRYEYVDKDNEGLAETLNRGVEWSQGEYISLIASDDVMMPSRVEELYKALSDKDDSYGLALGDAEFIDNDSNIIKLTGDAKRDDKSLEYPRFIGFATRNRSDVKAADNIFSYDLLIKGNYLPAMSVLMSKSALIDVGLFTPGVALEDWDLWLRMSRNYKGVYIDKAVSYYRMHDTNSVKTIVPQLLEGQVYVLLRELELVREKKEYRNLLSKWIRADSFRLVKRKKYRYIKYMCSPKLLLFSFL
jgi:alpha-1,3-rhamnosyltransferase